MDVGDDVEPPGVPAAGPQRVRPDGPAEAVTRLVDGWPQHREHGLEYWHELFAQASDGIFIADDAACLIDANDAACAIVARPREQLLGVPIGSLLAPGQHERLDRAWGALRNGRPRMGEWLMQRGDGRQVPVEVSARMLSDGRYLALVRDASQRNRREEAARAMAELLECLVVQRTAQLRRLAAELEAAEIRERRQIAHDLHDDIGQTLAAAMIRVTALTRHARADVRKSAADVAVLLVQANRAVHSLATQLAPAVLHELGLWPAVHWLADELGRQFGLNVQAHDDGEPKPLSQEARSIVYRAVRELLINVARHAGVNEALVDLSRVADRLVVEVCDAGMGFTPQAHLDGRGDRLGLMSVRERLRFIGGSFSIRSMPGSGTAARLVVPLDNETRGGMRP
jgi:PAS domain S-box-containing protein